MSTIPPASDPVHVLTGALSRGHLEEVRDFWFKHVPDDVYLTVPSREIAAQWFSQDDDYDEACRTKFGETLCLIRSVNPTATQIVEAAKLEEPLDWMSMIILLDQIPRNCYRQDEARIAYEFFDPIGLDIALQAIDAGVPEHPRVRFRHAYRFWFYMPLEHSERIEMQERVELEHDKMFDHTRLLISGALKSENAAISCCRDQLLGRRVEYETWVHTLRTIGKQHKETIKRFGRYPHRNQALGRQSTTEETSFLKNK